MDIYHLCISLLCANVMWDNPSQSLMISKSGRPSSQVLHSDDARSKALQKAKPQAEAAPILSSGACIIWNIRYRSTQYV